MKKALVFVKYTRLETLKINSKNILYKDLKNAKEIANTEPGVYAYKYNKLYNATMSFINLH